MGGISVPAQLSDARRIGKAACTCVADEVVLGQNSVGYVNSSVDQTDYIPGSSAIYGSQNVLAAVDTLYFAS